LRRLSWEGRAWRAARRSPLGGKGGRLAKPDQELIKSMIEGVQNRGSPLGMPPKGGDPSLTEDDIAAVLQYMRETFAQ